MKYIIPTLLIILTGFLIGYWIYNANIPKSDDSKLKEMLKEMSIKLDSISQQRDSVRKVIDSTHVKIITNEKHYQERINTIITQPDSFSESFTRQYIRDYATSHGYHLR